MNVTGIFKTLIIIVACVAIGALVLNILLPNVSIALVNMTEDMIFKATKMKFDFNKDGDVGATNQSNTQSSKVNKNDNGNATQAGAHVEGFK